MNNDLKEKLRTLIESPGNGDPMDAYWKQREAQIQQKIAGAVQQVSHQQVGNTSGMVPCKIKPGTRIYTVINSDGFGTTKRLVVETGQFTQQDSEKDYLIEPNSLNECVLIVNQHMPVDVSKIGEDIPNHQIIRLLKVQQGYMGNPFFIRREDAQYNVVRTHTNNSNLLKG